MSLRNKTCILLSVLLLSFAFTGKSDLLSSRAVVTSVVSHVDAFSSDNNTLGFDFVVGDNPVLVSDLGLFDVSGDGFINSHPVGLWDASGNLLASVTLGAGTSAPLSDQFRYGHLASAVMLSAGTRHVLGGGYKGADEDHLIVNFHGDQALYDPAVTGSDVRYFVGAGFTFPASVTPSGSELGPNAIFTVVPEPGVPALLIAITLCLFAFRKTRRGIRLG